ncbi:hypothetical protein T02_11047 [Trichinella nativa]|uniref:Uncharacterized protein n=1 Tax=Trichinella nativa TaxID=6335 RepID=A0A0V1KRH8_9BILA|nr:hypothetical protein T02_4717 [Trichinella nativa]KRZ53629.1 hypothetical protein T02_6012 [Trichinella nativa]KRZ55598.1 hypothetical protein T02_11047 [Trichinella nativa]
MNRSIDPKENGEYYPLTVWKTFLENFLDILLQYRNNAMRLNAFIYLDFDHKAISTTKASYSCVKLHAEKKGGKRTSLTLSN